MNTGDSSSGGYFFQGERSTTNSLTSQNFSSSSSPCAPSLKAISRKVTSGPSGILIYYLQLQRMRFTYGYSTETCFYDQWGVRHGCVLGTTTDATNGIFGTSDLLEIDGAGEVGVSRANDGAFGAAEPWVAPTGITDQAPVADYTGDGRGDLTRWNAAANRIEVSPSTGWSFLDWEPLVEGLTAPPTWWAPGDFDGDGAVDVAIGTTVPDAVLVALATTTTVRSTPTVWLTPSDPTQFEVTAKNRPVVGDFNGDDLSDIAAIGATSTSFTVALSNGTGFATSDTPLPAGSSSVVTLMGGDFDDIARTDLAWIDTAGDLFVAETTAAGTFNIRQSLPLGMPNGSYATVRAAEVTGDDYADIVLADGTDILVFPTGPGALDLLANGVLYQNRPGSLIAVGDFDGIAPPAPQMIEPIAIPEGIHIGWQMPDEATDVPLEDIAPLGFHVEVEPGGQSFDLGKDERGLTIGGLPPDTEHTITIWTTTPGGTSAPAAIVTTSGPPAPPAADAAISGTVTGVGGAPFENATVTVLSSTSEEVGSTLTAIDGTYTVTGLAPGSYRLMFEAPGMVTEWYDDAYLLYLGALIDLPASTTVSAIDAELEPAGVIEGTVTDALGTPLQDVWVNAYSPEANYSTPTAADGTYRIEGVRPGTYSVRFSLDGYASEFFGGKYSSPVSVGVAAGVTTSSVDAELDEAGSIAGTVTASGTPLSAGFVRAERTSDPTNFAYGYGYPVNGSYTITNLPPGSYTVYFQSDGYGSEYYDNVTSSATATDVVVEAGLVTSAIDADLEGVGSIAGTVVDTDGNPVDGATVSASGPSYRSSQTGPDGAYQIDGLSAGDYQVAFRAGGLAREYYDDSISQSSSVQVSVVPNTVSTGIDAGLAPGTAISGQVIGPDGAAIPYSSVTLELKGSGYDEYVDSVQTDGSGFFEFNDLPSADFVLSAQASTTGLVSTFYDGAVDRAGAQIVTPTVGSTPNVEIRMIAGGGISGVVTDESGAPVPFVTVAASSFSGGHYLQGATAGDGSYRITGVPAGSYEVTFTPPPNSGLVRTTRPTPVAVTAGANTPGIDAMLPPRTPGSISGLVTDPTGLPVQGVVVRASGTAYRDAVTGADGSYQIADLDPGTYQVSFDPPGGSGLVQEWFDGVFTSYEASAIVVNPNDDVTGIDAQLVGGGDISGTVTDDLGSPVGGVYVYAQSALAYRSTQTAADGTYTFADLPGSGYRLSFSPPSGAGLLFEYFDGTRNYNSATLLDVVAGSSFVADASLDRSGSVTGVVTDPTGAPIEGAFVDVSPGAEGPSWFAMTDASGSYTVAGVYPGSVVVRVTVDAESDLANEYYDDAYDPATAAALVVESGGSLTGIDFQLQVGGSVSGTVTDASGNPVWGAYVSANNALDFGQTTTARDGTYRITGLAPGQYAVSFYVDETVYGLISEQYDNVGFSDPPTLVTVASGTETPNVNAQLAPAGSLSGVIRSADGRVIPNASVYSCNEAICIFSESDDQGEFILTGFPAGEYPISISAPGHLPQTVTRTFSIGTQLVEDFSLDPAAIVRGRVTGLPAGVSAGLHSVLAYDDIAAIPAIGEAATGYVSSVGVSQAGTYQLELPAGTHYLCLAEFGFVDIYFQQTIVGCWNGVTPATATPLVVSSGDEVGDVDFDRGTPETFGLLRVTTSPALPSRIYVDGIARSDWGLDWLTVTTGQHTVCFSDVVGFETPPCESVTVNEGMTTVVQGGFVQSGLLKVEVSPAGLPTTIFVDGQWRDEYGLFAFIAPGDHEICWGEVTGFQAPECQLVSIGSAESVTVSGEFVPSASPTPGPAPVPNVYGYLRVTTSPAVPARVVVDGWERADWGLTWVKVPVGYHSVCFEDVIGFETPDCEYVAVRPGQTTTVVGDYAALGLLKVGVEPAGLPVDIVIDGFGRNQFGAYVFIEPGTYEVCGTEAPGFVAPACESVSVVGGTQTNTTLSYAPA